MIIDDGVEKLEFFQNLYEDAKARSSVIEETLQRNLEQYKGSPKIDGSNENATTVRNITYELIESQISTVTPLAQVYPMVYSDKSSRNAQTVETFLRNKCDELGFLEMNDIDERYSYIYGGSLWLLEWDDSIRKGHKEVGGVRVSCLSPTKFFGQPYVYRIEDMEYLFVDTDTTKADIVRQYGVSIADAEETETDKDTDECATVHICYYKDDSGNICQYIWSGNVELQDVSDYYSRKRRICKNCGEREELCECESPEFELQNAEYEVPTKDIPLMDGSVISPTCQVIKDGIPQVEIVQAQARDALGNPAVQQVGNALLPKVVDVEQPIMEETRLPFYKPKRFPVVIRKNTSQEDSLLGQSDCEFIRPQQQAINKVESRIMRKLMDASVVPVVPEDSKITISNGIFSQVVKMKPGENKGQFGIIDTTPDISKDIAEAERLYDHAKRILGISSSFQGQYDSSAQSGRAKQMQIQQAAGRLDSKKKMKNAAYSEIYHIIFELFLAYADEPRAAVYKDALGRWQNRTFNRYDFLTRDENGEWYYEAEFLFKAELAADAEKDREYLWQENLKNFQGGTYGDPAQLQTQLIYWLNMEAAHYPGASDNVERVKETITQQMMAYQTQIAEMQANAEAERANREEYEQFLRERNK